ncbi:MAG: hypothetical protein OEV81_03450 [Betaproteobacteria bacterium]|nr:hypothetical protein [Betaproteobacteria bacterium]MDH5222020.1 hypothetical protein [Betaproteobacteria bacterium]MDH5349444.1 hypothetical protein [Betaproteobacteria bacterium]
MSRTPVRLVAAATDLPRGWVLLRPAACPCCVGRVQLQVELARVIREQRPSGVQIEMRDPGHLPAMRRALGERPLSDYVET